MTAQRRFAALFFAFWALYGAACSLANLRAYTLQQMGVESLVVHHTFTLGHSKHALLQPQGDAFEHGGRVFAAKQPGQFVAGALPYAALRTLGLDYERDYDLAAAWVTWLSAGLLAALAVAVFERVLREAGFAAPAALLAAAAFGLGCPWLAYAGIAHHDVIATALLVFAARALQCERRMFAAWLLGSTLFVSMLPAPLVLAGLMACAFAARETSSTTPHRIARAGAGFALGLLPLLAYNAWYFGSPVMPANIAGDYADTFPAFVPARLAHHANAYFGSYGLALWRYAPVLMAGALALFLPRLAQPRVRAWLAAGGAAQIAFLLSIQTLGTCQYGPRYLLPMLPAFAFGVAALVQRWPGLRGPVAGLIVLGLGIALVGAIGGTMYCQLDTWALPAAWQRLMRLEAEWLPLRGWVLLPATAAVVLAWRERGRP